MAGSEIHTIVTYDPETHFDVNKNKFVYTTEQSRVIGQEQLCPKIMTKMKFWTFLTFLKI